MAPTFRFLRKTEVSKNQFKYLVLVILYKISTYGKDATMLLKYMMADI